MNDTETRDFEHWAAEWRSTPSEPSDPLPAIRARFRRYVALAVANWLIGLFMVVATTLLAWGSGRPELTAAAIFTWGFAILATTVDLIYRRGTWSATDRSIRDFLELARRRLVAQLRGIRFGFNLLALEVLFFCVWIPWTLSARSDAGVWDYLRAFGFLGAMVVVFTLGLGAMRKTRQRQLEQLDSVRGSLEPGTGG